MSKTFKLEEIPSCYFTQGYGESRPNRSILGKTMKVGGVTYRSGYGTHIPGDITLDLFNDALEITGAVGIDDETNGTGSAYFRIINADTGKDLVRTGKLLGGKKAVEFHADLKGVSKIRLSYELAEKTSHMGHLDLLNVRVKYNQKSPIEAFNQHQHLIQTKNLCWSFRAHPRTGLLTSEGFDLRTPSGKAIESRTPRTFPVMMNMQDSILPFDLYIIQADGSHNCFLLFDSYQEKKSGALTEHIFTLKDPGYPVVLEQHIAVLECADVFKVWNVIKNTGKKSITLVNRNAVSLGLRTASDAWLSSFHGSWGHETMVFDESRLPIGTVTESNSVISHNSQVLYPGCVISFDGPSKEDSGFVFSAALGWDGNWQYQVSRNQKNQIYFSAGAMPSPRLLDAGETYTTPFVLMSASAEGKGQVSRNFQKYMRFGGGIGKSEEVRPVILNSWEGLVFDFDEKKIEKLIDDAAKIGAEMFVLDDGWFANGEFARDDDRRGLGDWETNTKKLPHGLGYLAKAAQKKGLKFGLWFEPEMVNAASKIYQKHPEWVIAIPNRELRYGRGQSQLMLDLSQPEVEDYVYHCIADVLKKYPAIEYVKWDHNMAGFNQGSAHLKDRQGALSDLHNQACMRVAAKLDRDFPNVMFQLCASGGGRADVGTMENFDEFWVSDNSTAIDRLFIQWGFSHFYPAQVLASHISRHGPEVSYKFRVDVAMTGRLGVELNPPDISASDRKVIAKGIAAYKELRDTIHSGEMFRGRSPHDSKITELTFVTEDKRNAVLFAFDRTGKGKKLKIKASGLDPEAKYKVKEMNPDAERRIETCVMSGADLMKKGLEISFSKELASSAVASLIKTK